MGSTETQPNDPSRVAEPFPPSEQKWLRKEKKREQRLSRLRSLKRGAGLTVQRTGSQLGVIPRGIFIGLVLLPLSVVGLSLAVGSLYGGAWGLLTASILGGVLALVLLSD